jgi:hypothetical protein
MMLSNNPNLPDLPAWQARSTWAILLAALITLANFVGFDLLGFTSEVGAGATPDQVIDTGNRLVSAWQIVAPLIFGLWAWVERRAPNYRLVWPWSGAGDAM